MDPAQPPIKADADQIYSTVLRCFYVKQSFRGEAIYQARSWSEGDLKGSFLLFPNRLDTSV